MWIVINMAKSEELMSQVRSVLEGEGILVKVRPIYKKVGNKQNYYEIMVLESESEEANEILMDKGLL